MDQQLKEQGLQSYSFGVFKRSVLLRAKGGGAVCQGPSVEHGMHRAFANSKHTHFLILQVKKSVIRS